MMLLSIVSRRWGWNMSTGEDSDADELSDSGGFSSKWHGKRYHVSFQGGLNKLMEGSPGA